MSPDFRSLPLGFPEFWRIQLPKNPSRRCPMLPTGMLFPVNLYFAVRGIFLVSGIFSFASVTTFSFAASLCVFM